jgi:hypothetical protein
VAQRFTIKTLPTYFESFIGAPLTAFISASVTLAGKATTVGREGGAVFVGPTVTLTGGGLEFVVTVGADGLVRFSSPELQLEAPKVATSDNTTSVEAIRAGVHNDFSPLVFFIRYEC